jgi:hypothetical protein
MISVSRAQALATAERPVSLLATAHAAGWSVAGQHAAIQSAAHWLLRWRTHAAHTWTPYVTGDELDSDTAQPAAGRRDAWCYGAPGIGRALILAGSALADPQITTAGDAAIASLSDRPTDLWDVEGPTLCHGYAGVLQSATTSHGGTSDNAATAVTEVSIQPETHLRLPAPSQRLAVRFCLGGSATRSRHRRPSPPVHCPPRWLRLPERGQGCGRRDHHTQRPGELPQGGQTGRVSFTPLQLANDRHADGGPLRELFLGQPLSPSQLRQPFTQSSRITLINHR